MRKKFFVNPRLQSKHLFWTLLTAVASCGLGYFIFESITASIFLTSPLPVEDWQAIREGLRTGFIISLLVFVVAVGLEHYFLFHRVAGPLFALQRGLDEISKGNLDGEIHLRVDDDLKDLIASFEAVKRRLKREFKENEEIHSKLLGDLDEVIRSGSVEKIKDLKERLESTFLKSESKAA